MSLEATLLKRWPGAKIMLWSLIFGVAGTAPLLLYIAFGPKHGNPIGLGLLAVATVPFAGAFLVVGFIKFCIEYFSGRQ